MLLAARACEPTANMSTVGPTSFSTGMPFAARLFCIENGPSAAPAGSPAAAGRARTLSGVSCRGTKAQSLIEVRQHVGTQYCYVVMLVSVIVPVDGELCPRSRSWQRQTLRASEQGCRCQDSLAMVGAKPISTHNPPWILWSLVDLSVTRRVGFSSMREHIPARI